jgi:hypothetical protein
LKRLEREAAAHLNAQLAVDDEGARFQAAQELRGFGEVAIEPLARFRLQASGDGSRATFDPSRTSAGVFHLTREACMGAP